MASDRAGVVVDGAGLPASLRAGCRHAVAWYAASLAEHTLARLVDAPDDPRRALGAAIADVAATHSARCDLAAGSPSATVAAWTLDDDLVRLLALGDASVFVQRSDGAVLHLTDTRIELVEPAVRAARDRGAPPDEVRAVRRTLTERSRNVDGGFWCARHEPEAARQALTLVVPAGSVRGLVLASDGATRAMRLSACRPRKFVDAALAGRTEELLARTRAAERRHSHELTALGSKTHDDFTIAGWRLRAQP